MHVVCAQDTEMPNKVEIKKKKKVPFKNVIKWEQN